MALNGFSTCNEMRIGNFRIPDTSRVIAVRKEIAPLLVGFASEFHRFVEPITNSPKDDWGYNCRAVRGSTVPSFHAAGLAVDLNATRHPLGRRGTFNARQRATIRALCRKYGLRWGGDFQRRADEMHAEVALSRAQALALVERLQARPASSSVRVPAPRLSKLKYAADNSDVVLLQKRLGQLGYDPGNLDGIYGPQTRAAVRAFQLHQGWGGIDADGRMGPVTLQRLFG